MVYFINIETEEPNCGGNIIALAVSMYIHKYTQFNHITVLQHGMDSDKPENNIAFVFYRCDRP